MVLTKMFFLIIVFLFAIVQVSYSQAQKNTSLTKNDVVVDKTEPTIYLCIETFRENINSKEILWIRFYNNTIWPVLLNAEAVGYKNNPIKLSDGTNAGALLDGAEINLLYGLKDAHTQKPLTNFNSTGRGDMPSSAWLPSGKYVKFKVNRIQIADKILSTRYNYEWEVERAIIRESYGPIHSVEIDMSALKNTSRFDCK